MKRLASLTLTAAVAALVAVSASAESRLRGARRPIDPPCAVVRADVGVTFTRDRGRTFASFDAPLGGISYGYGLVATSLPHHLVASRNSVIFESFDRGCSWREIGEVAIDTPPFLTAGSNGEVYVWGDHRTPLYRVAQGRLVELRTPVTEILGFAVDPVNPSELRLAGDSGSIFRSSDGGESWTLTGSLRVPSSIYYRAAFAPDDVDTVVVGTAGEGAWRSIDGGASWLPAAGTGEKANVFTIVFSPVDSRIAWGMMIDLTESDAGVPSRGRYIIHSADGGASFRRVVPEGEGVKLINGPVMAPHATNRDQLYFVFGTFFQGYGTDLFLYDVGTDLLTLEHSDFDDINAIAFPPGDASVMFVAVEVERRGPLESAP